MEMMGLSCRTISPLVASLPLNKLPYLQHSPSKFVESKTKILKEEQVLASMLSVKNQGLFGMSKGGNSGLLERPAFEPLQPIFTPQAEEGGDIGKMRDKTGVGSGDSYRVLLIDDKRHTETLVAKALPKAVPSVTPDGARELFHKSRENGVAIVIVTVKYLISGILTYLPSWIEQEHAEFYAHMMLRCGLNSRIEPDSDTV